MAEESRTNGNIDDLAGTFHGVALLGETVVPEDGDGGVDVGHESCVVAIDPVVAREHCGRRRCCEEECE